MHSFTSSRVQRGSERKERREREGQTDRHTETDRWTDTQMSKTQGYKET